MVRARAKAARLVAAAGLLAAVGMLPALASAEDTEFSMDAECTSCHVEQSLDVQEAADEGESGVQAEEEAAEGADAGQAEPESPESGAHAALACVACHDDEEALTQVHEGVTADDRMPRRLKKAKIDETLCLSCHGSYEELAEATEDGTALTDTLGTTVNPHALPENDDHASLDCLDCHTVHGGEPGAAEAQDTCLSCHHMEVYTPCSD